MIIVNPNKTNIIKKVEENFPAKKVDIIEKASQCRIRQIRLVILEYIQQLECRRFWMKREGEGKCYSFTIRICEDNVALCSTYYIVYSKIV